MAKPLPNDLTYGHVGQATYNLENAEWNFAREPGHAAQLQQLGSWKTVFEPPTKLDDASSPTSRPRNVRDAQQAAKSLGRSEPTLLPSLAHLPKSALTSASIASATETYDPAIGELLSFGSFTSEGLYTNARPIVAHPTGSNGNVLCLGMLTRERNGWGSDKSIWVQGPSMVDVEKGFWVEDAVPIQQICFAQGDNRASFLAVRLPMKTRIFRPVYHDRRKSAVRSPLYELPSSRIDPHPILSISPDQTGGAPHADVTFNPDYQRQFGIVDQKGNWSIWDIDGGSRRVSKYTASCTILGPLRGSQDGIENTEPMTQEDGWARILWVGDVNTVVVCNRRELKVFDISGNQFTALKSPELMAEHAADWILDVKKHPLYAHRFFVLTSTHLFLAVVTCKKDVLGNSDMEPGARILLSWTHFRGLEDITLQLCTPVLSSEETVVFLFSHLNRLVTVYNFQNESSDTSRPVSCSDPAILTYDDVFGQFDTPQHVTHIHMDWLHYRGDEHLPSSGPGSSYSQHDVQFYRLSVMLSDLSIRQAIFYTHSPSLETIPNRRLSIEPTAWTNIIHARGTILLSEDLVGLGDDFIIPDGIDTASVPALKTREGPILPPMQSRGPSRNEKYRENASTVNYSDIYDALTGTTHWSMTGDGPLIETEDVSSVIARLRTVLFGGSDQNELLPGTMMETCDTAIRVTDVDDASLQIQELLDQNDRSHPFEAQRVAFLQSSQPGAPNDHQGDMSSLYDSILQHWIASLPASIPSRTRQMKERQARRIAAEVVLASSRIRRPIAVEPELLPPSSKDWPTAGLGQVHEVSMSSQRSVDFTGLPHLPEPSSSQPASQQTAPTHPNAITRLGQHLQITKPPPTMSPNISQVLMHWHPGADPRVYDWDATTRLINAESNIDELGQKQRERSKRKAERLLKKQMRELELEKRKAESQPVFGRVVGGLRSSPAPVVGLGLSSQTQTESSQDQSQSQGIGVPHIVQSQIEPGRHGGKPQVKKRKGKARVSGF